MSFEQDVLGAIDGIFSLESVTDQDKASVALIHREVQKLSSEQKSQLASYLLQYALPPDNEIPLLFFLYDCFEDIRFLEALLPLVPESPSVPWFYEFYWNLSHRLFRNSTGSAAIQTVLRDRFYRVAAKTKKFLSGRGLLQKQISFEAPKRIAILVPQLMNMRHSPTREAYNIALHLHHTHGCNVHVINTNAMNYPGCNQLNLLMPADFEVNQTLNGQQQIPINYMQFSSSVSTVSLQAGPMTSQKIANIASTLQQLEVEALIAHGENLLVMESLYGFYPSLFATTGAVVPFNHCDAYFIPGNLFNDSAKAEAQQYQHENFMLESMLVTPEGQAEVPASRETFGLTAEDFLYLVVGTRLTGEMNNAFAQVCEQLLAQNTRAKIIIAGTPELALNTLFSTDLVNNHRVVNIGFQQDLPGICAMCDAYLNPERAGGGTSSQTAILNGLPVVTLNHGHISAVVPQDKRQPDWQSYFAYANQLQQEPDFHGSESELFKQHFFQHLDSAAQIARMYDKLVEVAAEFE